MLLEKILLHLHDELQRDSDDWKKHLEQRLYKRGEDVIFIDGAADSNIEVKGRLCGIGENGELLITPVGEAVPKKFITGELKKE